MMRVLLLLLSLLVPASIYAEEIKWDESSIVNADINCDGTPDTAKLGFLKDTVRLMVVFSGDGPSSQSIEFRLGMSGYQDALCGKDAKLSVETMDYDLTEIFGENPEGFKQSKSCKGLNVRGSGGCDSMHIFWNHKTGHINWWRL